MVTVISFDIDGRSRWGSARFITIPMVASAKERGWVIGSCSDRPLSYQTVMWERLAIVPDFTVLKHRLDDVRDRFPAHAYYHIGDTDVDGTTPCARAFSSSGSRPPRTTLGAALLRPRRLQGPSARLAPLAAVPRTRGTIGRTNVRLRAPDMAPHSRTRLRLACGLRAPPRIWTFSASCVVG